MPKGGKRIDRGAAPHVPGAVPFVTQFRHFRNTDPPALVEVWNESFPGRGAYRLRSANLLEHAVLAKSYFDPMGLIVAEDEGKVVGFSHAGFGPNSAENGLEATPGVVCMVAVKPSHRRRQIGSELLRRAEEYLKTRGSVKYIAGGVRPINPFYFGLYGGADSPASSIPTRTRRRSWKSTDTRRGRRCWCWIGGWRITRRRWTRDSWPCTAATTCSWCRSRKSSRGGASAWRAASTWWNFA